MQNLSQKNLWLNIDKPIGYSSAKVVAIVKRVTGAKKVGHAGTLDPLASGLLMLVWLVVAWHTRYVRSAPSASATAH